MGSVDWFRVIRVENFQAFIADGAASIVGVNNSVATRLRNFAALWTIIICSNHAAALCTRHAAIDNQDEVFLSRDIYTFMNFPLRRLMLKAEQWSYIRCEYSFFLAIAILHINITGHPDLKRNKIDENNQIRPHALVKPFWMRWLTMAPAVDTLLTNWIPVRAVLQNITEDINRVAARNAAALLARMDNPMSKALHLFLNHILPSMDNLNGWMQTNRVVLPEVYPKIKAVLLDILNCSLDRFYLATSRVEEIDPQNEAYHRPLRFTTVGPECTIELGQLNDRGVDINPILQRMRLYLVTLATQIATRLEQPWRSYSILECLLPINAISAQYHQGNPGIILQPPKSHYTSGTSATACCAEVPSRSLIYLYILGTSATACCCGGADARV
ncbi:hypothetical protein QAD02_002488 [Eretmocerus hayati]|uniref:Uncharacterized protein n=1 Tax=Eretmocerus hayati TaxID=131215 RepID=A0ACC2NJ09_9HYME|nr:hypothetical protein QAD02_002488 [Eretmocerus hayati]